MPRMNIAQVVRQARRYAQQNPDKVLGGLDRVAGVVNQRTGNKYAKQVDRAGSVLARGLGVRSSGRR